MTELTFSKSMTSADSANAFSNISTLVSKNSTFLCNASFSLNASLRASLRFSATSFQKYSPCSSTQVKIKYQDYRYSLNIEVTFRQVEMKFRYVVTCIFWINIKMLKFNN